VNRQRCSTIACILHAFLGPKALQEFADASPLFALRM
jgi:hypothetical protein